MCLITKQEKPFIATEDIHVWKLLNKDYKSILQGFPYVKGELYETTIESSTDGYFNPFSDAVVDYMDKHYVNWEGYKGYEKIKHEINQFGQGYHGFNTIEGAQDECKVDDGHNDIIVEFIIPKGAEYYICISGVEFVSNQIKML